MLSNSRTRLICSLPHRVRRVLPGPLSLILALALLAAIGWVARADTSITFDLKSGDKVSDVTRLVAHVDSQAGINKVEFYVDDKLRATITSVPYLFEWDTLTDAEGMHTVKVVATDENSKSATASLPVVIDNELSGGAASLAQRASSALGSGDLDTAQRYARRALKVEPDNLQAARALAEVTARGGDYAQAATQLGKAKGLDADSAALLQLASYKTRLALSSSNADHMVADLATAADLSHKAADLAVETARRQNTGDTPEAHEAIGDALLNAGRNAEAVTEYSKSALANSPPLTSVNRLALAQILSDQPAAAVALLKPFQITKQEDAPMRAVFGLAQLRLHHEAQARAVVQGDLVAGRPAAVVVASYADLLLARPREAEAEATRAVSLLPNGGDAAYALAMSIQDQREVANRQARAIALAPLQPGPYTDLAGTLVIGRRSDHLEQALGLAELTIKLDPTNVTALLIKALVELQTGQIADAKDILTSLYKKDQSEPDVLLGMSTYCNIKENATLMTTYLNQARDIDPLHFQLQYALSPQEALMLLVHKTHYRSYPFLTPATLYPPTATASAAP